MAAHDGCAGGDGCTCVHSIMTQRCPCAMTGVTYTACTCCVFKQSLYAHVLPAHLAADVGTGRGA
eukprot:6999102-Prorocentrum_lima.AAC.1